MSKGKILVTPLNWGLGHATRSIPVINALLEEGYTPIIASDGKALVLLKQEFPKLKFYDLPELDIKYSKNKFFFKFSLISQTFKFFKSFRQERQLLHKLDKEEDLSGIISDNRLGFYHKDIPCAVMSHQLKIYSGSTTWLSSKIHQYFLSKYDECWVPDKAKRPYLSGKLGHVKRTSLNLKYIGFLSRFNHREVEKRYDVLVLISGPEPQRTIFEKLMLAEFKNYKGKVALVRGIIEDQQNTFLENDIKIYNYLKSKELEALILESEVVIARSGYTSLMDLAKLKKKVILIPTPGQPEQQYLAKSMKKHGIAPYSQQRKFSLNMINDAKLYAGLHSITTGNDLSLRDAFRLFERK